MLAVTEAAVTYLQDVLDATETDAELALHLVEEREGQLALTIDAAHEGDQIVARDAQQVLLVSPELSDALDGPVLDAVEEADGVRIALRNPRDEGMSPR